MKWLNKCVLQLKVGYFSFQRIFYAKFQGDIKPTDTTLLLQVKTFLGGVETFLRNDIIFCRDHWRQYQRPRACFIMYYRK